VGYKYYESRYYDSVTDTAGKTSTNAKSTAGSSDGKAWDYSKEVLYTFGSGLSYLEYEQNIKSVTVDKTNEGNITARIDITNKSSQDGKFTAQLYVQQPYTTYDKTNLVEKSAIMFLNSAKVEVKAGQTSTVEITIPTKYLASYDYTKAKTYILDEGDYYFTAAAGSHEAINNILTAQGYTMAAGMDADGKGSVVTWNCDSLDTTTYATENGTAVTNVADDADLNYWLPNTVTYLSRSDWQATYPKNYNTDVTVTLANSSKKSTWIEQLQGKIYTIDNTGTEATNVNGKDNGVKFTAEYIGYDQLTNIDDAYWDKLVSSISVDQAIGGVIHGGSRTDVYDYIENAIVTQNEGVNGYTTAYEGQEGDKKDKYYFNISSQTLLGSSFNPDLAWDWGVIEGESGLWLQRYDIWGTGLTQRRTPYNGRNYEYISEDPMLTNRIGYGVIGGAKSKGTMCGPKHIGFNDQEYNRNGISVYINEQKMRETDLRGFQGGLEDAGGLAVMVAFNRIGAINACHHQGMLKSILRNEWAFKGIISTDMATNYYYFNAEACIMATVNQIADFSQNDNTISGSNGHDTNWTYISVDAVKNDAKLVNQARENLKYQFYAFANSGVMNISTIRVVPSWEVALKAVITVSAVLFGISAVGWIALTILSKKEEN
jgi:beta-glucosidase